MSVADDEILRSKPVVVLTPENTGWSCDQTLDSPNGEKHGDSRDSQILEELFRDSFSSGVVDAGKVLRDRVGKELRSVTAEDFGFKQELDRPLQFFKFEPPLDTSSLRYTLQALLEASVHSLKSDPSEENVQRILLDVLTKTLSVAASRADAKDAATQATMLEVMDLSTQFVEAHVTAPQFNSTETSGIRILVFNVYHRLAKVLGRNTPEAVIADSVEKIRALSGQLQYPTSRGRHATTTPEKWIDDNIKPLLDPDQKNYIREVRIFSGWPRLYDIWNNRASKLRKAPDTSSSLLPD